MWRSGPPRGFARYEDTEQTLCTVENRTIKRVKPPRAVLTRFPRGATVGAPGHHEQQRQVLLDTLATLEEAETAGELYPLPYRWEGEATEGLSDQADH